MKVDQVRGARIVSNLKKSMNKEREKKLDAIIPMEEDSDPYKVDDNDEDEIYKPSPKKRKVDISKKQRNKTLQNRKTKLTRQERLERLKSKTSMYNLLENGPLEKQVQNSASKSEVSRTSTNEKTATNDNQNAIFSTKTTSQAETSISNSTCTEVSQTPANEQTTPNVNHDAFFGGALDTIIHNSQYESEGHRLYAGTTNKNESQHIFGMRSQSIEQEFGSDHNDIQTASNAPILLSILAKMEKLSESFELLRRQVARVEAKSTFHHNPSSGGQHMENAHAPSIGIDAYLDYNASLATEGLPISTCEGVDALENKLQNQSYRQGLVSCFWKKTRIFKQCKLLHIQ